MIFKKFNNFPFAVQISLNDFYDFIAPDSILRAHKKCIYKN